MGVKNIKALFDFQLWVLVCAHLLLLDSETHHQDPEVYEQDNVDVKELF